MAGPTRINAVAAAAAVAGAALLVVSPFLVWGKVAIDLGIISGTASSTGMDSGYGWITLVLGLAVAGLLVASFLGLPRPFVRAGWVVLALGTAALSGYELTQVHDCAADFFDQCLVTPDFGPGLFVALAGAAATFVAALAARAGRAAT